jgi:uncharacterized membrane protein
MKTLNIWDRLSFAFASVAFAATVLLYSRLPDPMPVHFDAHGAVNGTMPKWLGAWFGFAVGGLTFAFLRGGHRLVPDRWRLRMQSSPMRATSFVVVALLAGIQGILLYASIAAPPNVARVTAFVLGAFWLLFGLLMPRIRRNPYAGIRTPWTLTSDEVWARTHRLGGHLAVAAALVCFFAAAVGSLPMAIAAILVSALLPAVYSFFVARRLNASPSLRG